MAQNEEQNDSCGFVVTIRKNGFRKVRTDAAVLDVPLKRKRVVEKELKPSGENLDDSKSVNGERLNGSGRYVENIRVNGEDRKKDLVGWSTRRVVEVIEGADDSVKRSYSLDVNRQSSAVTETRLDGVIKASSLSRRISSISDVLRDSALPTCNVDVQASSEKTPTCCRLPYNGHHEDKNHYDVCPIVLSSVILKREHAKWLKSIPDQTSIPQVMNYVIGSSCTRILVSSKCTDDCSSNHRIALNFNFPPKSVNMVFNVFTKWFVENATSPDFRSVLLVLSQLPRDSNALMIALSYVTMAPKLPEKFRSALWIKLVEILVNAVGLLPEEAVRTLLLFAVTPNTEQIEVSSLLSLEKSNVYQAVSCLWHINDKFVCPTDLIFPLLKHCVEEMPEDLKLTKDRIVVDLLKLPRRLLHKKFHIIDKFLSKFYPLNSKSVLAFRSSVLYRDVPTLGNTYESCRVKSTGPVNPKWSHWSIHKARVESLGLVLKDYQKTRRQQKVTSFRRLTNLPYGDDLGITLSCCDAFKLIANRNILYHGESSPFDLTPKPAVDSLLSCLRTAKYDELVEIISSYEHLHKANSLDLCMETLEQAFLSCNKADIHRAVLALLKYLPGSLAVHRSIKSAFARMLNGVVRKFYVDADYDAAIKLLKTMRIAGVNHLEHAPDGVDQTNFIIMCSDIHFQLRLYREAIRTLRYNNCIFSQDFAFTEHLYSFEYVVKNMLRRFLRERRADLALHVFRLVLSLQRDMHYPLDIGVHYEAVIFLCFSEKTPIARGDGANLYVLVDQVCGNGVKFRTITYRSLLVELYRVNAPKHIVRRVLLTCLQRNIYPDFALCPNSPLVLDSHLSKDEMAIYLTNYFAYLTVNGENLTGPFVVRFAESPPPDSKPFPVPNHIMKTPRSIEGALARLKSALDGIHDDHCSVIFDETLTIPPQGVEKLIEALKRSNV